MGEQAPAPIIADADVILAVGTRFQATGATKDQVVVHLDVDPTEIGRHFADAVPVVGDAVSTLAALLTELQARSDPRPSRAAETRAMRERVEDELRAIGPAAGMVETLREAVPDDGVLVPCTTTMGYMSHMHYRTYAPRTYLSTSYMGTLGRVPRRAGCQGRTARRTGGVRHRRRRVPVRGNRAAHRGAVRHQHRDGRLQRQRVRQLQPRPAGALRRPRDRHRAPQPRLRQVRGVVRRRRRAPEGVERPPALREAIANDRPTVIEVPMERLPSPF